MARARGSRDRLTAEAVSASSLSVVAAVQPELAERLSMDLVAAGYQVTPIEASRLPPDAVLALVQPVPGRGVRLVRRGPLELDLSTYRATIEGRVMDLTFMEWSLLRFLAASPGTVHARRSLLANVWGYDFYGGMRTVDVHVRRLRSKLGQEHGRMIETVRNVGYRLVTELRPVSA